MFETNNPFVLRNSVLLTLVIKLVSCNISNLDHIFSFRTLVLFAYQYCTRSNQSDFLKQIKSNKKKYGSLRVDP